MKGFWGFVLVGLLSTSAMAAQSQCASLAEDLKAMQSAQRELLQSLSDKSGLMASVLDQSAEKLEKIMAKNRGMKRSDLSSLRMSAKAYRNHEQREKVLISKFQRASDGLLDQVRSCLAGELVSKN